MSDITNRRGFLRVNYDEMNEMGFWAWHKLYKKVFPTNFSHDISPEGDAIIWMTALSAEFDEHRMGNLPVYHLSWEEERDGHLTEIFTKITKHETERSIKQSN